MNRKCVVIGSGIAGLAVAIRLRKQGWQVVVYERSAKPGGKINELIINKFRFDIGPTVLTMPWLIDDLFQLHEKDPRKYFRYERLEEPSRYFFNSGLTISTFSDLNKTTDVLEEKTGLKGSRLSKFFVDAATKFKLTNDVFLKSSLHRLGNYTRWEAIRGILLFYKVGAFTTMARWNRKIFRNSEVERIFNRYAQYVGSDPYQMSSTFNVIPHIELEQGVFHASGGMHKVVDALLQLCADIGVEITTGKEVEKINHNGKRITGIMVSGETIPADLVVSNADIHFTYRDLLGIPTYQTGIKKLSSSAVLFCWGVRGSHKEFGPHNFIFGDDCEDEFRNIFEEFRMPEDGAIYLHINSRLNSSDAPSGCESWFVMMNAPPDNGQEWNKIIPKLKSSILRRLGEAQKIDLSQEEIIEEKIFTPKEIGKIYHCNKGAIYGNNSNSIWSAFLRHANFSRKIRGLYFTGGSVHPGAGIPLCLNSAEITSRLVEERE